MDPVLTAFLSWNTELESVDDSLLARLAEPLTSQLVALDLKLADALPSYMIPAMYIPLHYMPLTVSGKTDLSQLQTLVANLSDSDLTQFSLSDGLKRQPTTRIEKKLQQMWSEILDLAPERIGQNDSFFRLGGDSLSAIRLTSRASQDEIHLTIALIFQNSKLRDMAAAADDLSSKAVYDQLQEQFGISKESVVDFYPCTPLQESLMILSMKQPGSYRQRHAWTLPASVRIDLLKGAINVVTQREPILRTRIINLESTGSLQVVIKEDVEIAESHSEADFWEAEQRMPMTYGQPLLKCCVLQRADEIPKLLLTMHHVLYDEWSIDVLLNRVETTYNDLALEKAISSQLVSSSFANFVDYIAQNDEDKVKAYWQDQLSGASPVDFPRLPSASHQPGKAQSLRSRFDLPANHSKSFGLPILLKAAWSIIVARYSASDDITFGLTVQGRDVPVEDIDLIVGPTLATVPLRMRIDWSTSIKQFISSVRDQADGMKAFEHVGLQRISHSAPETDSAWNFQHLIVIHNQKPITASTEFWRKSSSHFIEQVASYPLTVQFYTTDSTVEVTASYDESVLNAQQMDLILANLEQVLAQLVTTSDDKPLKCLNLLGQQDQRIIVELNSTIPAGLETRIDELFDIQRVAQPNAEAVHSWDAHFTYQELYEHAIRLAHHLQALGVGPEVLVPLCFDKSAWTIVAQLGVLYAGGAFVAMDATHPAQRLQQTVKDTSAPLILASTSRENLCHSIAPQVFVVTPETIAALPSKASPPVNKATSRNTAYVLFTSGSTGRPKGVVMEHRGVCTAAMEQGKRINMNSNSRVLQYASYAFDSTILETFHTLFYGGCICPLSQEQRMNDIVGAINQLQANWAFFTPVLIRTFQPEQVPCLKTVVLGGEALGADNIEVWAKKSYLANGYGPTETCVFSSILDRIAESDRPDNIGRSVGGANWVVCADDHNLLVPIGAVGELLIEGPTVARGYLNDKAKTEQAFIRRPDWLDEAVLGRPVERVYKTGDLVTMRADGTIFIIGRKDTQVKIRGQRVELGEIEHNLKQILPGLAHLAVDQVCLPRRDNTKVLAAFLCRDSKEREDEPTTLRIDADLHTELVASTSTITDTLPAYMIPTIFILLSSMPLSSSGKTDRRRLRTVAEQLSDQEIMHFSLADVKKRAPITEMEKKMQSMWATVLGVPVESIGCDDSFLRLGGDSLGAMKLAALARRAGISVMVDHIFKNPTLSAMSSITTKLKEEAKEELEPFSLLRGPEPLEAIFEKLGKTYGIARETVQDIYPTSSLQEGLMMLSVRQPGTYNFQWNAVLPATIDRERFQRAWKLCVKRNTILRTRIIYTELSGSLQVVLDDESQWTTSGSLEEYLRADKLDIMDYGKPLTRWAIVADNNGKEHFVWSAHHSIYDGWALPLVLQEVTRIYHATDASCLPTPPPYARFIEYLERRDQNAEVAYWHSQYPEGEVLSSFPPVQSSAIQPLANITVTKDIDFAPGNSLSSGFTTSTLIRAAWAIVLSRYAEANNALFGALLAGRNVPIKHIASMTGPTITTVPVHISVSPAQTIHSFLDNVQRQAVEMMSFEHTGLQNIKQFTRETGDACNFQNLLVIQPKQESSEVEDLWRTGDTIDFAFDEFLTYPLVFQVVLGRTLGLTIKLDDRLLSAERGQRMLEHFSHVIHQLSKADMRTLAGIDITCPTDISELQHWNDLETIVKTPIEKAVHDIITDQAKLLPEAPAVSSWDDTFTYVELDTLSSRVASHLKTLGVGLETYVLLCFDKSAWAIVAMLGILKAGAAYVAVDPMHPTDRKAFIARDVSATVAVTSPQHQHMFDSLVDHVVGIERSSVTRFALSDSLPPVPSSNPAFVVFTSGSTGTPKGIVMEHGAFATGAHSHAPALHINRNARVLQFAAYTYDVSMGEIFSTLMHGGCVCVPTEEERLSNLAGAINSMSANWLFLTPTVASLLDPATVPTLQHLVLGGEHATTANIQSWAEYVHLTNSYGPAECAIWTNCAPGLKRDADPSNIGRRIGSLLWIVEADNHDKLTPVGCVGELIVESHSLARGYLNDPAKTKAAFIEAPRWAGTGRRMYKTGDLAKYNFDGTLSIVGRKDNQVKLNGQRMELGEVEHHLWADEEVNKAMAIVPTGGLCKKHLVSIVSLKRFQKTKEGHAFVVVGEDRKKEVGSQISRLREKLASKLPKYMVPTIWVVLEDLPLNASGKLDRRRVSEWIKELDGETYRSVVEVAQGDKVKTQPSNNMEATIRKLWSKVLGVAEDNIGMDDNFLQAGGDSITAVRLTAAARQEGITLLVRDIFQKPVLRAMSMAAAWEEVEEQDAYETFSIFTKVEKRAALEEIARTTSQPVQNIQDVLEATDYQSWTLAAGHLQTRGYMNYFGIRFDAKLDMKKLKNVCQSVIARHPILRTVFVVRNQCLMQVILEKYEAEYARYEQEDSNDEGIPRALIEEEMNRPVKLGDQIVRFILVRQRDNNHRLVLRISHAQYDGISLPSILQDIKAAYEDTALSTSKPYSSFIHHLRSQDPQQSKTFWSALLENSQMTNILHHKKFPYKNPINRMLSRTITHSSPHTQDVTFATTVKAAWALVLSALALTPDTVFGQVVSGRNGSLAGIQDVIGPCMNILPVRVPLQSSWTNADLVRFVQDQHLASMPHENYGMRHIVERCTGWPRATRFSSIYQHTNFGNQFFGEVLSESAGSEMTGYAPPHDVADVWIWTAPVGGNRFSVDFTFAEGVVEEHVAQKMLDMLCRNIEYISANGDARVAMPGGEAALIPITYDEEEAKKKYFAEMETQGVLSVSGAEDVVSCAWEDVFGAEGIVKSDVKWWHLRGGLMPAVHLAEIYSREAGRDVSVEAIIENGTREEQIRLLRGV
jgi:amino acid adenylation domain-containing protein